MDVVDIETRPDGSQRVVRRRAISLVYLYPSEQEALCRSFGSLLLGAGLMQLLLALVLANPRGLLVGTVLAPLGALLLLRAKHLRRVRLAQHRAQLDTDSP